ncbi:hypothetical protein QFC21_007057 [Naganishia friedmannii]|uniref:Uncharacterized protein n=1 Tax=Naganishia friedmannii TaxID=89922 RepID=A0ACC2UYQ1_9TREE|nr:hypothetical protein QFC21_007057 [Naganishia friedmannii]
MSGRRVYVGKLPPDVRQEDIEKLFRDFKIRECRLMAGFGFVEFEEQRDAEDAVSKFDGAKLLGEPIMVEFAKERRPREAGGDFRGGPPGGAYGAPGGGAYGAPGGGAPRRGPGVKVLLKGVGSDVSWQDLKDFGREAGRPLRADVDRNSGDGFLEYGSQEEAQSAVEKLSTMEIRGRRPEVAIDTATAETEEVIAHTVAIVRTVAAIEEETDTVEIEAETDMAEIEEAIEEATEEDTLLDETNLVTEALRDENETLGKADLMMIIVRLEGETGTMDEMTGGNDERSREGMIGSVARGGIERVFPTDLAPAI